MKSAILKSHQKRNDESCKSRHGRGIVHVHTPTNSSNLLWLMTHWFIPQSEIWPSSSLLLFKNSWNVSRKTMYFSKRLLVQEMICGSLLLYKTKRMNAKHEWSIPIFYYFGKSVILLQDVVTNQSYKKNYTNLNIYV